jgi:hypothetical protein
MVFNENVILTLIQKESEDIEEKMEILMSFECKKIDEATKT